MDEHSPSGGCSGAAGVHGLPVNPCHQPVDDCAIDRQKRHAFPGRHRVHDPVPEQGAHEVEILGATGGEFRRHEIVWIEA